VILIFPAKLLHQTLSPDENYPLLVISILSVAKLLWVFCSQNLFKKHVFVLLANFQVVVNGHQGLLGLFDSS